VEARQSGDLQRLLAVFRRLGQADTADAATAVLYAGLSDQILAGLTAEHAHQVLTTAQEVLIRMTDKQAWKSIYRATARHPDWHVRAMLLDVVQTRVSTDERAQKALVRSLTDSTDAVAFKAIDMAGDLRLKQAVPALMRLVIAKWGQHVGIGAAKATAALEKITGTAEPAGWHEWMNKNL
jgi:HEAT repeat protein